MRAVYSKFWVLWFPMIRDILLISLAIILIGALVILSISVVVSLGYAIIYHIITKTTKNNKNN